MNSGTFQIHQLAILTAIGGTFLVGGINGRGGRTPQVFFGKNDSRLNSATHSAVKGPIGAQKSPASIPALLAVIRKRRFLDVGRVGLGSLAESERRKSRYFSNAARPKQIAALEA